MDLRDLDSEIFYICFQLLVSCMENDGMVGFSRKQPFLCFKYISFL